MPDHLLLQLRPDPASSLHSRIRAGLSELEALVDLGRHLATGTWCAPAMSTYLDELRRALRVQCVALRVPDESAQGLVLLASSLTPKVALRLAPLLSISHGISSQAFLFRRPIVSNDYTGDDHAEALLREQGVGSVLALPIMVGDVPIATLSFIARRTGHFTPGRAQRASALAGRLQALLYGGRLAQTLAGEVERGQRRLEAFRNAASRLYLQDTAEATLQHLVNVARELTDARYGALVIWRSGGMVEQFVTSGLSAREHRRIGSPPQGVGLLGLVRDEGAALRLADLTRHPKSAGFPPHHPPMGSLLAVPILSQGQPEGTFYLTEKRGAPEFTQDDERLLSLFAVTASVVLENVGLYTSAIRQRHMLSAIQESMAEGLVLVGSEGRITYCNQPGQAFFGGADAAMEGRPLAELLREKASELEDPGVADRLVSLLGTRSDPITIAVGVVRPRRQDLAVTVFPIHGQDMTGLSIRDVTNERELDRRKDAFVSVASHELRTPLTSLVGFAELLLTRKDLADQPRLQALDIIHKESLRLTSIVDDLLNASRIQSGRLTVHLGPVIFHELVEETLTRVRPTTDRHRFVTDIAPGLPPVWADLDKLAQVLINLLSNAVKYSPSGGVVAVAAAHDGQRDRVVVSVKDQGVGIAPGDREQMFTTFHRIRSPQTEGIRGSGLGLYIVKSLLELMNGQVWVESEVGHGSTFFFSLPTKEIGESGGGGVFRLLKAEI